jgi:exopolyphosphatase/pppGpp-phosphohydrolase
MQRVIFVFALFYSTILNGDPQIRSVIDIGTGKIKMQTAKIQEDRIESIYCQSELIHFPVKELLSEHGLISQEGENEIIASLEVLKELSLRYGSTDIQAIATELFRKASNGLEVAKKISDRLDMDVKIISQKEEGILSFLTVVQETSLDPEKIVVLDIGSGSFQITCKTDSDYCVYSAPFGRIPTHELVVNNQLNLLREELRKIDPQILKKIQECDGVLHGIGAHPKQILKTKMVYDCDDLKIAVNSSSEQDSDLLLVQTIFEELSIKKICYRPALAGNTSGVFYNLLFPNQPSI